MIILEESLRRPASKSSLIGDTVISLRLNKAVDINVKIITDNNLMRGLKAPRFNIWFYYDFIG